MKFHGIKMAGSFVLQKVTSLPTWTPNDEGRLIYDTTAKKLYVGSSVSWTEAGGGGGYGFPVTDFIDNRIMEAGKMYFIDSSSGSLGAYLEDTPNIGDTITIVDVSGTFDMYSLTINGNGNTIHHDVSLEVDIKDVILILVWTGTSWKLDVGGIVKGGGSAGIVSEYDSDFTAQSGLTAFVDTRNGIITVTMPDENTLSNGTKVTIIDQYSYFNTNKVICVSTQAEFENGTTTYELTTAGSQTTFMWNSASNQWKIGTSVNLSGSVGNINNVNTSSYNALPGDFLFLDTTLNPITINLPPSGQIGSKAVISIYDQKNNFNVNNVTVIPSYGTVDFGDSQFVVDDNGVRVDFIWDDQEEDWKLDIGGDISNYVSNISGSNSSGGGMGGSNPVIAGNNTTANVGDFIFCNTETSPISVELPDATGLNTGDSVSVMDLKGTFNSNNVTVNAVNATIDGDATFIADIDKMRADFIYDADVNEWMIDIGGAFISGTSSSGGSGGSGGLGGSLPVSSSSNMTANIGDFIFCDTSTSPVSITLPDATTLNTGDSISIMDLKGTFNSNNATITAVNATIDGDLTFIADINKMRADFIYDAAINEWMIDIGGAFISGLNSNITYNPATENDYGLVKLATPAEVTAGTTNDKVVTPASLSGLNISNKWTLVNSNLTGEVGNRYLIDTTNSVINFTLPATATDGDNISFADGGNFSINNLVVLRNGKTIEGLSEDMTVSTENMSFELVYYNNDWKIA